MNKIKEANALADRISELSGVDIFKNTRQARYVESRSLLIFLLYNTKDFRLADIERYFQSKGKNYNHATALYAVRNFDTYRRFNKDLNKWLTELTNQDATTMEKQSIIIQNVKSLRGDKLNNAFKIVNDLYTEQLKEPAVL